MECLRLLLHDLQTLQQIECLIQLIVFLRSQFAVRGLVCVLVFILTRCLVLRFGGGFYLWLGGWSSSIFILVVLKVVVKVGFA